MAGQGNERKTKYEPRSKKYKPITFLNVEFGRAKAILGVESRRIVIEGRMSVNVVDSAKWGREVHIQVYAPEHRVEERNPSEWCRMEIYFPIKDLDRLIEALLRIKLRSRGIRV